jgi:hypothetical protein
MDRMEDVTRHLQAVRADGAEGDGRGDVGSGRTDPFARLAARIQGIVQARKAAEKKSRRLSSTRLV